MEGLQTVKEIMGVFGYVVSFFGFLVFGFAVGRFVWDGYKSAELQIKLALVLGFFGLGIVLAGFLSPGSAGAYAFGAGVAFVLAGMPKKEETK